MTSLIGPSGIVGVVDVAASSRRGTGCVCQNLYEAMSFLFFVLRERPVINCDGSMRESSV